jgi:hypothetical protein
MTMQYEQLITMAIACSSQSTASLRCWLTALKALQHKLQPVYDNQLNFEQRLTSDEVLLNSD